MATLILELEDETLAFLQHQASVAGVSIEQMAAAMLRPSDEDLSPDDNEAVAAGIADFAAGDSAPHEVVIAQARARMASR
jgi:predicted transcriptional regulator